MRRLGRISTPFHRAIHLSVSVPFSVFRHGGGVHTDLARHVSIRHVIGGRQDDPGPRAIECADSGRRSSTSRSSSATVKGYRGRPRDAVCPLLNHPSSNASYFQRRTLVAATSITTSRHLTPAAISQIVMLKLRIAQATHLVPVARLAVDVALQISLSAEPLYSLCELH